MLPLAALHALAEQVIVYDADRAPERVTVYGSGVGVSRGLARRDAIAVRVALHVAVRQVLSAVTDLDEAALDAVARRLVVLGGSEERGRYTVTVCGSELVGAEDPAAAESRARSMRAVLVAELQRALADAMPPTVRRPEPQLSAEGR